MPDTFVSRLIRARSVYTFTDFIFLADAEEGPESPPLKRGIEAYVQYAGRQRRWSRCGQCGSNVKRGKIWVRNRWGLASWALIR